MKKGFTLVEMLISVSIFSIVMLASVGAVFSIVAANQQAHSIKSVMTNLDFALQSMTRDIRLGSRYACGVSVPLNSMQDCPTGDVVFRFKANRDMNGDGNYVVSDNYDQVEYSLVNGQIQKKIYDTTTTYFPITAPEVHITSLKFYASGSGSGDGKQPKVVMVIQGYSGVNGSGSTQSNFNIQTTVTQRAIDS